jgi:hypothetical protein
MTAASMNLWAESIGFLSSVALAWQAFRLIRHQRAVRDLRTVGDRHTGTRIGELAERGAQTLEETIGRWDAVDQWLVVAGLVGIAVSFALKLVAIGLSSE